VKVGNPDQSHYPDQFLVGYTYDALQRLLTAVDSGGHAVELGYNDHDQVTARRRSCGRYAALTNTGG
jgi:YD repeat-containing protein